MGQHYSRRQHTARINWLATTAQTQFRRENLITSIHLYCSDTMSLPNSAELIFTTAPPPSPPPLASEGRGRSEAGHLIHARPFRGFGRATFLPAS